jgi:hypothetical protein
LCSSQRHKIATKWIYLVSIDCPFALCAFVHRMWGHQDEFWLSISPENCGGTKHISKYFSINIWTCIHWKIVAEGWAYYVAWNIYYIIIDKKLQLWYVLKSNINLVCFLIKILRTYIAIGKIIPRTHHQSFSNYRGLKNLWSEKVRCKLKNWIKWLNENVMSLL